MSGDEPEGSIEPAHREWSDHDPLHGGGSQPVDEFALDGPLLPTAVGAADAETTDVGFLESYIKGPADKPLLGGNVVRSMSP